MSLLVQLLSLECEMSMCLSSVVPTPSADTEQWYKRKGGAVSLPGGKLVDVTVAVFGPDDDLVCSDELPSSPDLVVVTGHRAEQRVVTCIEDLTETHIFNHFAVGSGKTKQKILSALYYSVVKQVLTLQYLEQTTSRLLWVKVQKEILWQPWQ